MNDTAYQEIGTNYRFFLAWRHATFAGGVVILWGTFSLLISACEKGMAVAWLVPLLSALIVLCLWIADCRTRQVYRSLIRAGKTMEGNDPGPYHALTGLTVPKDAPWFWKKGQESCKFRSQSCALDLFFGGSLIVLLFAVLLVLMSPPSVPYPGQAIPGKEATVASRPEGDMINGIAIIGPAAQWFAGFATLAIVVLTVYRDYWKRPRLFLDFENERDVKSQSNTVGLDDPQTLSRWLRVRVKNAEGRKAAKNCRAFLIGIKGVGAEGTDEDMFPNDVRPLIWTHEPSGCPAARDLLPGVVHWIDVVAAIDNSNVLHVQVQPQFVLKMPGNYLFTVQVSAEDADSKVISVRVDWDGTWQSLCGQQI